MARRDILPSYLSQQAWLDLCDAVDLVFKTRIDDPTNNLGKLRRPWSLPDAALVKISNQSLLVPSDLDVFESEVQVKQINTSGLILSDPDQFSSDIKARFFRHLPRFWYSKGTQSIADFLSFVMGTSITISRMWTNDYVTFLVEGDPGIGTPIYLGGTWYPTTQTQVELDSISLPGDISIEVFARMFESICNYPLVPQYVITASNLWVSTAAGNYIDLMVVGFTVEHEVLCNFGITPGETSSGSGEGGFESIAGIAIAGPGGTGYTPPSAPVAGFTASASFGISPITVTFTNTSTGSRNGSGWDFNGDTVLDSTVDSAVAFTYTSDGIYTVTLTVFNSTGSSKYSSTITVYSDNYIP